MLGSPGSGNASTSSSFRRPQLQPPQPQASATASAPASRKRPAPKTVSFPAWHKHWNRYHTLVSDRFAADNELAKACGMSHHGTATVTDFLNDFSHDEVAFLILDRNQGEIRSMDYTELNHVLIDMVPHMSNLTTGAAIAPSSKKVLLRDIVKKWEAAKYTTVDPLDHKTMSFDNRFPDVIKVWKEEVHAIAESEDPV